MQYLWGIASGSPVVHPDWVEECITKDCLQPYKDFQLPSGFSMLHKRFIFQDMPITDVFTGNTQGHTFLHWSNAASQGVSSIDCF